MSICCIPKPSRPTSEVVARWKRFLLLLTLLFVWSGTITTTRGAEVDDQYLKIFRSIESADELAAKNKAAEAKAKYEAAYKELSQFRKNFPAYNAKLVNFRLNDLNTKIELLSRPAPEVSTETTVTPVKAVDKNAPQIKLLNPGAEPRTVLRLQPQAGDKQNQTLVMKMGMGVEMPGQPGAQNIKIPPLKMDLAVEVQEVAANGDIVYVVKHGEMSLEEDPSASPEMAQALKAALGDLSGISAVGTNTSRGINKGLAAQLPPGTNPQMRQMLDQMNDSLGAISTPLPEEAIGLGAKWETKMSRKSQGMTIEQTTSAELIGLEEHQATVKVTLTQRAANQKISNPAMPGLKFDLTKMTGSSHGEITLDLKQLMPAKAVMDSKTEMAAAFAMGNQKQSMKMSMDIQLTLQNK